jgi:predicted ArsR family transcriptional regulator
MTDARRPPGFDPQHDVLLDARNLRGLVHPLRARMLTMLRESGPATATMLAERLGESSAATSYHLRQLAAYGFVVDDERPASGRQRWWRSAHRSTYFDTTGDESDAAHLLGMEYLRGVVHGAARRMEAWVDAMPGLPRAWRDAGNISDYRMQLTPEQAVALIEELDRMGVARRADDSTPAEPGARRVNFQFQVLPDPRSVLDDE